MKFQGHSDFVMQISRAEAEKLEVASLFEDTFRCKLRVSRLIAIKRIVFQTGEKENTRSVKK